ncbi:hypothetical protein O181_116264 [Austropuccinia psidii MF-1]|uniref:Zn(2)-C6 fungal-type domain-containing protein n=1 Tax=Austropuccinia psidii MF-1 TaxID=1389203 RepID=A0A9Q3KB60_9BASI|nr:hypothetical protein [Austropuccinia psidii MF-1]
MSCTLCTKQGIPCIHSSTNTNACDACRQAHKKCFFAVCPFRPRSQRSSCPRRPCKDSFVVNNDETISKCKWAPGPHANGNDSGQLALSPQVLICPPPLLGHHSMVTSLLNWSEVIIRPMKDGDGKRTFELGPIVTNGIQTPNFPREQTLRQPTPGLSGTRWLEELFHEPSQTKEPPIPGPSPSSEPLEDVPTCEPEPEVAPMQSTEEPFRNSPLLFLHSYQLFLTFSSTISSLSRHSLLDNYHRQYAHQIPPSHSNNDACQEFTDLRLTLMIP